jgi:hypothetical protein
VSLHAVLGGWRNRQRGGHVPFSGRAELANDECGTELIDDRERADREGGPYVH